MGDGTGRGQSVLWAAALVAPDLRTYPNAQPVSRCETKSQIPTGVTRLPLSGLDGKLPGDSGCPDLEPSSDALRGSDDLGLADTVSVPEVNMQVLVRSLGGRTLVLQIRGPLVPSGLKILISDKSGIRVDRFGILKE